ncbi:hypothetical protein [Flavobacterium sp. LB2P6]
MTLEQYIQNMNAWFCKTNALCPRSSYETIISDKPAKLKRK